MLKLVRIVLMVCATIPAFAQAAKDSITWSPGYCLSLADFQGMPAMGAQEEATSNIAIYNKPFFTTDSTLGFYAEAVFIKKGSWIRPYLPDSNYILIHEQGHFDLAHAYALKLQHRLDSLSYVNYPKNRTAISRQVEMIFEQICRERDEADKAYDTAAGHCPCWKEQDAWNRKIAHMLQQYNVRR
jgi:hypothetical protein